MENEIFSPLPDMTNWETFAFVCDGEVAFIMKQPPALEHMNAVFSSNPTVIKVEPNQDVEMGYLYKDGKFVRPDGND